MRARIFFGASCCVVTAFGIVAGCVGDEPVTTTPIGDAATSEDVTATDTGTSDSSTADAGDDAGPPQCDVSPCVVQISAGGAHTCARIADGTVRCWGRNLLGQCGGGTVSPASGTALQDSVTPDFYAKPHEVAGLGGATVVGTGGSYRADGVSCVGTSAGKMQCWGIDRSQQLGRGGVERTGDLSPAPARPEPAPVVSISNVSDISVGARHVCAVFTAGAVACWGGDIFGTLGFPPAGKTFGIPQALATPTKFTRVVARGQHNLALAADRKVWSWGNNRDGQHGVTAGSPSDAPVEPIAALTGAYVDIAAGRKHGCAIDSTGKVWCWGSGSEGQLGRGPSSLVASDPVPGVVSFAPGTIVKQIAGDEWHMVALLDDGTVWRWGTMITGQTPVVADDAGAPDPMDTPISTPQQITLPGRAKQVVAGYEHACALLATGAVHCWGNDRHGELGRGTSGDGIKTTPAPVVF